ncbi:hypothetical protein CXP39_03135 [Mesoplasma syrphidae]|uniref:Uncharacterized protein n=1 Tax=Mesoplasma syrphidae TaxID=225999 RepID=A0A2K9C2T0_9MOLU|nr:hypothetical protein [Mesoplasma syrphidae]AUF83779.1 hypothetical protein CXP39_03135 [Mesoplasma syrphidae]
MTNKLKVNSLLNLSILTSLNFLEYLIFALVFDASVYFKILSPFVITGLSFLLNYMWYWFLIKKIKLDSNLTNSKVMYYDIMLNILSLVIVSLVAIKIILSINYSLLKYVKFIILNITLTILIDFILLYLHARILSKNFFSSAKYTFSDFISFLLMIFSTSIVCSIILLLLKYQLKDYVVDEKFSIFDGYVYSNIFIMITMITVSIFEIICFVISKYLNKPKKIFWLSFFSLNPFIFLIALKKYRSAKNN